MNNYHLTPSNLGYFVFNATDLPAWKTFLQDIIGLQVGSKSNNQALVLRIDSQEQRILIQQSDNDDLAAIGWELDSEESLDALAIHVESQGVDIQAADSDFCSTRAVEKAYICTDPNGVNHELYFGAAVAPMSESFKSSVMKGEFLAERFGAGHYVAIAEDKDDTNHFYRDVLCLRLSDYIRGEIAPGGPVLDATFMHTKTGRHHSAAFAALPFPKKLHHFMLQVEDMNDVGLACQRCKDADIPFFMELGHHPNDQMFSFYVATPGGFGLEIGWGGLIIEEGNWEVKTYSQPSDWGHQQGAH
ncbi:MAG TPA: glyoxalase [Cycloclasticus sp.]|jgi:2,3-dihydroxybiphenyl 1,2-dioxygenase|nr:glyoxalase [Cycloclasticus sp.]HIL92458.1 glyoxalase [Cycloclasticus sp.]